MSDSPVKKLDFAAIDKENIPATVEPTVEPTVVPTVVEPEIKKPVADVVKTAPEVPKVAPTIKPTEVDEPLLQENPQRFVLFPIKYHEVRERVNASRVN